jgi:hypothetical protein
VQKGLHGHFWHFYFFSAIFKWERRVGRSEMPNKLPFACSQTTMLETAAIARTLQKSQAKSGGLSFARVGGWRRSAVRAGLRLNSLVTGNFTGNFAILQSGQPQLRSESLGPQVFLAKFPKKITGYFFSDNREFFLANSELG